MEFFSKAFTWLAELSSKLPVIEFKTYFIVVVCIILGVGLAIGLTLLGSNAFKLKNACTKIIKYLAEVEYIDEDSARDFTNQCFSSKTPQSLRDSWVQYLGVRFGYPSDLISEKAVYDKEVKNTKNIRANIFVGIALILVAIFAFWGYGTLTSAEMGVVHCAGLVLSGAIYLVLVILTRAQNRRTLDAFNTMQEDLDAKVNLQVEKNYATDASPMTELAAIVDEIIARNIAKVVEISDEMNAEQDSASFETPIEALIDRMSQDGSASYLLNEPIIAGDEEYMESVLAKEMAQQQAEASDADVEETDETVEEYELTQAQDVAQDEETVNGQELSDGDGVSEDVNDLEEAVDASEGISDAAEAQEDGAVAEEEATDSLPEASDTPDAQTEETVPETEAAVEDELPAEATEAENISENDGTEAVESSEAEDVNADEAVEEDGVDVEKNAEESVAEQATDDTDSEEEPQDSADVEAEETPQEDSSATEEQVASDEDINTDDPYSQIEEILVIDGDYDDDEVVKPAQLVKLPHLIDYMLAQKMTKKQKIKIATMLKSTYDKFKDSPENREILLRCMTKVMQAMKK